MIVLYTRRQNGTINIKLLEGDKLKIDDKDEKILKAELVKFKDGQYTVLGDEDIDKFNI